MKQPQGPLSQVVFIHDYLQLVFQDEALSIYNAIELDVAHKRIASGEAGICDALVSLIGQHVSQLNAPPLIITFSGGARLRVAPEGAGPEAYQLSGPGRGLIVEQNVQLAIQVLARVPDKEILLGGEHHAGWLPAGASTPLPVPIRTLQFSFEIQFDGDGYLLCYASKNREFDSDTWHKTLEEAKQVAHERFGIHDSEWLMAQPVAPGEGPAAPGRR